MTDSTNTGNKQPPVEVVRSDRRTRTASARLVEGKVVVRLPTGMPAEEEKRMVDSLVGRVLKAERRRNHKRLPDLKRRAADLNRAYFKGKLDIRDIKWVANQDKRYGSCTPSTHTIRISDRVASLPTWVLDYVLVHELAHLIHPNHSPAFWKAVSSYPLTERARGYLMALSLESDTGPVGDVGDVGDVGNASDA